MRTHVTFYGDAQKEQKLFLLHELLRLKIDNAFEGLFSKGQKEEMEEQIFIRGISTAPSPWEKEEEDEVR